MFMRSAMRASMTAPPAVRPWRGQGMMRAMLVLKGKLIVATPPLVDPNFDRTVVLVLEHGDDGALGLVLNRPTDEEVEEMLPGWQPFISGQPVLFDGGPVDDEAIIGLAWVRDVSEDGAPGDDGPGEEGLGTLDLSADPDSVAGRVEELRLFRGYAGWGPGQLEGELEANAWIVVDADRSDAFTAAPDSLWRDVLRRQGGALARMGDRIPDDVSMN
jgi:putative transcriptional regulator